MIMALIQVPNSRVLAALSWLKSMHGAQYGHDETAPGAQRAGIRNIDCSELAERSVVDYLEIKDYPDYSLNQLAYCRQHGREIDWQREKVQSMDLVFLTPGHAGGMGHVAIALGVLLPSQGGGIMLIEARSEPWNHVTYTPLDLFVKQFGARFAGVWRLIEIVPSVPPSVPVTPV
jgi:hypothetical protein